MTVTPGFAPIFAGWNVWSVWQKNDLDTELGSIGLDPERRLRVWVEDTADAASGAQLHDPLNPSAKHFDGDEVDVLQNAAGLAVSVDRSSVPPGVTPIDGDVTLRFVRFFNRGQPTVVAWPHSSNYMLESVYAPSATNSATNAPAPTSATEQVGKAVDAIGGGLNVAAWIGGGVVLILLLAKLGKGR